MNGCLLCYVQQTIPAGVGSLFFLSSHWKTTYLVILGYSNIFCHLLKLTDEAIQTHLLQNRLPCCSRPYAWPADGACQAGFLCKSSAPGCGTTCTGTFRTYH